MKIEIWVKPGSKIEKIEEKEGGLAIFIHAKAHDGEANKAIVEKLAKYFGVAKSQVEIVSGLKSRKKIVEIIGVGDSKTGPDSQGLRTL